MVQATLASIQHYCPNVPICLIVDGKFDVSDLERTYRVITLRVPELPLTEMRNLISGNYRAKLAAMWEGPFEFYVWMDSDAIVWGDFTDRLRKDVDFQIFWSEISINPQASEVPDWLPHFYFDPNQLYAWDIDFDWRGLPYFSSGAFACRRNCIPFDKWKLIENWGNATPGLFAWGEMGMLNYAVHSMAQRGELRVELKDLQHVWGHHGKDELNADCRGAGWNFPREIRRPRIAHFCGRKPSVLDQKAYSRPFTIARLAHHRRSHTELGAWRALLSEDSKVLAGKIMRRFERFASARNSY